MIIDNQAELTGAVLAELERAANPRFREIMGAAVRHLHDFVRDSKLTEMEFRQACGVIARLGQLTTPSHNEVVLAAGSLGVSALVCLLNNGDSGRRETTANLMGPFWRKGSPRMESGGSIVRSPTPGEPVFVQAWVRDEDGRPVADAVVDIWQASGEGFYENQDPGQADMNLRGQFVTDARGHVAFRTVKPSGYPIPITGPVGDLLRAQGRHNMRPAHIHFLIHKPGFKTQFSQLYSSDDPHLDTDVQFGVTRALVGQYVLHQDEAAPDPQVQGRWYSLDHHFVIGRGDDSLPAPPITAKTDAPRPDLVILQRTPS
ncbi:MAG: catechol 1,2-dioxygenase [Ramlibacter sp.]|nr:catechol 1,2-dioxygenase [Ramlibacter sp.]MDB5914054.1 catechol 1,2-dioxygenase [Ramlibacter sp.]